MDEMFPIQKSSLYQRWLAEHEEIAKNKWFLSEKMGRDCGWDYAKHNWEWCHRSAWLKSFTTGEATNIVRP